MQQRKIEKEQKKQEKEAKTAAKQQRTGRITVGDDGLWASNADEETAILGRDRLQLIAKISQYKLLFPENKSIQKLKISKQATVEQLTAYLAECQSYIETSTVESFITDAALQIIGAVEHMTVPTRFNISGLSNMLKQNPQFNSLCRQLYLKYQVFSNVPPEHQLLLVVITSAWVCVGNNKRLASAGMERCVNEAEFE